MATVGFKGLSA